jgi:geranylgeranyl diphosphate synthase, type II
MVTNMGSNSGRHVLGRCEEGSFRSYVARMRPEINEHIGALLSRYGWGSDRSSDLRNLMAGGKRLRAGLSLLTFDALQMSDGDRYIALDLAAAVEIAHSASLILDDMLDGDEMRRGRKAAHVTNGQKKALLDMTGLLSVPYSVVNVHGSKYTECLARTHRAVVEGEIEQIDAFERACTLETYERIISLKTGEMFSLAARFGAMAAESSGQLIEQLSVFGLSVGTTMQIADDIADLGEVTEERALGGQGSELLLWRSLGLSPNNPGTLTKSTDEEKNPRMMELLNEHIGRSLDALPPDPCCQRKVRPGPDHKPLDCLRCAPKDIADMMMYPPTKEKKGR